MSRVDRGISLGIGWLFLRLGSRIYAFRQPVTGDFASSSLGIWVLDPAYLASSVNVYLVAAPRTRRLRLLSVRPIICAKYKNNSHYALSSFWISDLLNNGSQWKPCDECTHQYSN